MSTESSNKLTAQDGICCKLLFSEIVAASIRNIYKMCKLFHWLTFTKLKYSAAFTCPHRSTHHSYTYWYSPTPGPMFVGDITIDNIVFSNPMTIYLLTMANVRACICKYYKCQTSLFRPEFAMCCFTTWVENWIPGMKCFMRTFSF